MADDNELFSGLSIKIDLPFLNEPARELAVAFRHVLQPWVDSRKTKTDAAATVVQVISEEVQKAIRGKRSGLTDEAVEGFIRWSVTKDFQHFLNVGSVVARSLRHIKSDAKPSAANPEWLDFLLDKVRFCKDDVFQEMWARILAGEINQPGSVSKRSIEVVSTVTLSEAEDFQKLCGFCWMVNGKCELLVPEYEGDFSTTQFMRHEALFALMDARLIVEHRGRDMFPYRLEWKGDICVIEKLGKRIAIEANVPMDFPVSTCSLTKVGQEIAGILPPVEVHGHFDHLKRFFSNKCIGGQVTCSET